MLRRSLLFLLLAVAAPGFAAEPVDYMKDVKPILTVRCYACHGSLQQKAGLRADTAKALIDAGAVVPGKSAASPIMGHVQGKPGVKKMPPAFEGETLTFGIRCRNAGCAVRCSLGRHNFVSPSTKA